MKYMTFEKNSKDTTQVRGFTLIEMLVALSLFSIVLVIAVGSLVSLLDANRKARTQKMVTNNLSTSLELMSRTIREGSDYAITNGGRTLTFTGHDDMEIVYTLNSATDQIMRSIDGESPVALTAADVTINDLTFTQTSYGGGIDEQPKILITLAATAGDDVTTASDFQIQTTVSKRLALAGLTVFGSSNPENPQCDIPEAPGRYFVNFEAEKSSFSGMISGDRPDCYTSMSTGGHNTNNIQFYSPVVDIPAGTYNVTLVSFDIHCNDWPDCNDLHGTQPHEEYRIRVNGWVSNESDDIPDDMQQTVTLTDEDVNFSSGISGSIVEVEHRYSCDGGPDPVPGGSVNSVYPACVVFDRTDLPGSVEIEPF